MTTEVDRSTRQKLLDAALKQFADCGYAGASVQAIVDAANVAKPALYYYFENKAALYQALVDWAHDERYRLMQEAAAKGTTLQEKLVEIFTALFGFLDRNRALMRLTYATAFASPGEMPPNMKYLDKPQRNFDFIHSLIKKEVAAGRLTRRFSSEELTTSVLGLINIRIMRLLVMPEGGTLTRKDAERIVDLFLSGAATVKRAEPVSV